MNNKKRVLFVATVVKSHINVFHLPYLKWFKDNEYETHVCARDDFDGEECMIPNCDLHYDIPFERSPISIKNFKAYKQLKKIISDNEYDIIHCNTPVASILTRLAAIKARKRGTKVIYTAHGFHFFKGASLLNWILYYPAEKICSYFTDVLITINKEDYTLAKKKMKAKKIEYVPGVGINTSKFRNIGINLDEKRKELGLSKQDIVLLSVGELSKRKNHEVIIRALAKIDKTNVHYIIVGRGKLEIELKKIINSLNLSNKVHLLGFRDDIDEICNISDIFCFPSKQEGLPVAVMEAMASGLPVICSDIRGNCELIKHEKGGYLCDKNDIDRFAECITELVEDYDKRKRMSKYNMEVIKSFSIEVVKENMDAIYEREL